MVRHGRTAWNAENRGQGQTDIPLDAVGLEQAASAGAALALLDPEIVWSSDLSRARDTAAAIGLPVVTDPRLREIDLGRYEGLTPAEWEADDPRTYALWRSGHDVRRGGGETYGEVGVRAAAAVKEALAAAVEPARPVVVVAHGGTIRALLVELLDLPSSPWSHMYGLDNTFCADLFDAERGRGFELMAYGVPASCLRRVGSR